jgi:hypothetical protein
MGVATVLFNLFNCNIDTSLVWDWCSLCHYIRLHSLSVFPFSFRANRF